MKKNFPISVVLVCIAAILAFANAPQTDSSIEKFWTKFKGAVISNDKQAVAALTALPVTMPYGVPPIKTRAALLSRFKQVFNGEANAAKCFATAKPEPDSRHANQFTVGCDNGSGQEVIVYRFVLTKSGWKFKVLDNINE